MLVPTPKPVTSEADYSSHQLKLSIPTPDAHHHPWLDTDKRGQTQGIKPRQAVLGDGPYPVVSTTRPVACGMKNQLCGFVCGCPSLPL